MNPTFKWLGVSSLLFTLFSCSDNEPTEKVKVVRPVKLLEINLVNKRVFTFPGEVEASKQANLSFRVSGEIMKYAVKSGQLVKQGEKLVEIDPDVYQLQLDAKQAAYDLSKVKFERANVLVKDFLISQQDFDQARSELQVSESLLKTAKANLSYTEIHAPYDGIISATYSENYQSVNVQQPIMSIQSNNAIDVVIALPERLIPAMNNIRESDRENEILVTFSVAKDKKYSASLKTIGTVADADTGSYRVKLTLPKPEDLNASSGMSAIVDMELMLTEKDLVSELPRNSLMKENQQWFVWRFIENTQTLEKAEVTFDDNNRLLEGLNDGDLIVVSGVKELASGQKVKPWNKERGL